MLKERVYLAIRHRIIIQDLKPGDLLNEKELMSKYAIGKTPLREVFFRLQQDGLIRRFPRSGTVVTPVDFKELRDAAEIRLSLEVLVGRLACRGMTPAVLTGMRENITRMEKALSDGASDAFSAAESSLHATLYNVADNTRLHGIMSVLQCLFARMLFSAERTGLALDDLVNDWRELYAALADNDEIRSGELNKRHFQNFYTHLRAHFY